MARPKGNPTSTARTKLEGRIVGGKFSQLANYSDLFERSNDGIALVDIDSYEILEVNPRFVSLLDLGSLEGKNILNLFQTEQRQLLDQTLHSDGRVLDLPHREKIFAVSTSRVKLADYCEVYQVIFSDVTAERTRTKKLESDSLTDAMTGLPNFRAFKSRLALEHESSAKKGTLYAVLLFDVDHFKHYNDRNGHPAGDEALRRVGKILKEESVRGLFPARYGGEEFVVLLSDSTIEKARNIANEIREKIEKHSFPFGQHQPLGKVTTSVGVALSQQGSTADEVIKSADSALYEAKKAGRNRVMASVPTKEALSLLLKKPA